MGAFQQSSPDREAEEDDFVRELIGPISREEILISGQSCSAILDSGSQVTTVTKAFISRHPSLKMQDLKPAGITVVGAGEQDVPYEGVILIDVELLGTQIKSVPALVVSAIGRDNTISCLLGTNALRAARDRLHSQYGRNLMHRLKAMSTACFTAFQAMGSESLALADRTGNIGTLRFEGKRPLTIRPGHHAEVKASSPRHTRCCSFEALLEGNDKLDGLRIDNGFAHIEGGEVTVMVTNVSSVDKTLLRHTPLGRLELATPLSNETDEEFQDDISSSLIDGKPKASIPGLNLSTEELTASERQQLDELLMNNTDVFSAGPDDFGCTDTIVHDIPLIDSTPFRMPYRRISPTDFSEVKDHLKELQAAGIIVPSKSPFASPIVIVRKKDGKIRLCVDYRKLNTRTIRDAFPLPRIDESLDALRKAKYFTSLDLMSGYLQVQVAKEDQMKTAFTTPMGLYEYTRMPFGLMNAPATFQRLMNTVFGDMNLSEILIYLDDVIVFSSTLQEHLKRLESVFTRLRQHGLKLKPSKCHILQKEVKYLGHVVSENGVSTDPEKVSAVRDWPVPRTKKDVRSFLGFTGYYRRFIRDYAKVANPLFALVGNKVQSGKRSVIDWTPQCQEAFNALKEVLVSAPVLAYPDFELPFLLQTDASLIGLGAVLAQVQDGKERVIAYASKSLTPGEARYPAHKLEFKALHWAATVKFRDYVVGRKVTAVTDNNPLTYVLGKARLDAHGQRWVNDLAQCNLDIEYRPGKSNDNADSLSRISSEEVRRTLDLTSSMSDKDRGEDIPVQRVTESHVINAMGVQTDDEGKRYESTTLQGMSLDEIAQSQKNDDVTSRVIELVQGGSKPGSRQMKKEKVAVRMILRHWNRLEIYQGVLWYRREDDHLLLVLPKGMKKMTLHKAHRDMGHLGVERTLALMRDRYFRPGLKSHVQDYIHRCKRCTVRKTRESKSRAPLSPINSSRPLELVCLDFLSLESSRGGIENVLVVTDHFTRYAQAYPTKDQTAATVAKTLWSRYIVHYGIPDRIHSDQGRCFEAAIIKELCALLKVEKTRTTPYHPQGNGMTERFNSTLMNMLGTLEPSQKTNWKDYVETMTFAYNTTKHTSTGYSPSFLMFGREPRIPLDLVAGDIEMEGEDEEDSHLASTYVDRLRHTLQESYRLAIDNAVATSTKMKETFDKATRDAPFTEGDKVLVANKAIIGRQKLADKWLDSPFTVVRRMDGQDVYIVKDIQGKEKTVHRNLLTTCTFFDSDEEEGQNVALQEDIVDSRSTSSRRSTRSRQIPKRYEAN